MSDSEAPEANGAPKVAPLDVDGVGAVIVGTVLWAIAFVALLFFRDSLEASGSTWWLAVTAAGFGFGLLGLAYTTRRRSVYRAAAAAEDGDA